MLYCLGFFSVQIFSADEWQCSVGFRDFPLCRTSPPYFLSVMQLNCPSKVWRAIAFAWLSLNWFWWLNAQSSLTLLKDAVELVKSPCPDSLTFSWRLPYRKQNMKVMLNTSCKLVFDQIIVIIWNKLQDITHKQIVIHFYLLFFLFNLKFW